jgi:hypothetical protein
MNARIAWLAIIVVLTGAAPLADTLVLQNGRRIQGELIGVYGREIEFEERNGGGRRVIRVPRREIARIEFDEAGGPRLGGVGGRGNDDPPTGGIPRGMRERRVNVTAREPWTDTGIDVRSGQAIYFSADGEVRWGPNRRDGADGERNSPSNPGRPLPDRPAASLIGRVGDGNDVFFIGGDPGPFRVRGSGRLYLGINDDVFTDNTGTLRVTVAY